MIETVVALLALAGVMLLPLAVLTAVARAGQRSHKHSRYWIAR